MKKHTWSRSKKKEEETYLTKQIPTWKHGSIMSYPNPHEKFKKFEGDIEEEIGSIHYEPSHVVGKIPITWERGSSSSDNKFQFPVSWTCKKKKKDHASQRGRRGGRSYLWGGLDRRRRGVGMDGTDAWAAKGLGGGRRNPCPIHSWRMLSQENLKGRREMEGHRSAWG